MPTFRMLAEALEDDKIYVDKGSLAAEPNNDTDKAIRLGLQHSDSLEDGQTFWDTFMKVFKGDAGTLSDLLHIPKHRIAAMPHLVHSALEQYKKENAGEKKTKKQRSQMSQTGNTLYDLNKEQPALGAPDNPASVDSFSNQR